MSDEIVTYPPSDSSFEGAVTAQRWGARGTLRGGAGTPREKVELLVWLYGRAGIEAEAVVGTADHHRGHPRHRWRELFGAFDSNLCH